MRPDYFVPAIDTSEFQGMHYSGAAARDAGVRLWVARCNVGWGKYDLAYPLAKKEAEDNGILFGGYGVNWPINRNPRREAEFMLSKMLAGGAPPSVVIPDIELGTNTHSAGHEKISARELIEQMLTWCNVLEAEQDAPVVIYTGNWWLTHPKIAPELPRYKGELSRWPLWLAEYPYQGWGVLRGIIQKEVKPETFDPWEIKATLPTYPTLSRPASDIWTKDSIWGWQWSSLGKPRGIHFIKAPYDRLDYSVLYGPMGPLPPKPPSVEERLDDHETRIVALEASDG